MLPSREVWADRFTLEEELSRPTSFHLQASRSHIKLRDILGNSRRYKTILRWNRNNHSRLIAKMDGVPVNIPTGS